jgi:hypothetical protein
VTLLQLKLFQNLFSPPLEKQKATATVADPETVSKTDVSPIEKQKAIRAGKNPTGQAEAFCRVLLNYS